MKFCGKTILHLPPQIFEESVQLIDFYAAKIISSSVKCPPKYISKMFIFQERKKFSKAAAEKRNIGPFAAAAKYSYKKGNFVTYCAKTQNIQIS